MTKSTLDSILFRKAEPHKEDITKKTKTNKQRYEYDISSKVVTVLFEQSPRVNKKNPKQTNRK